MKPYPHQYTLANKVYDVLNAKGLAYLAAEERTGKTLAAILVCERTPCTKVLVLTKKKAIPGWLTTLEAYPHAAVYTVTNYHQAVKLKDEYDIILMDEAHNYISSYPKTSAIWKAVATLTKGKPIVYISATPHAQGYQQLYHQFKLSSYSPWRKHATFYSWFKTYGKQYSIELNGIEVKQYTRTKEELILPDIEGLFITATRESLGFEFEPEDKLHWITLGEAARSVYNELLEHNIVELHAGTLVCDTNSKLRYALHQLEGGTAKIEGADIVLGNQEKVQYILDTWGDVSSLAIMYNYKAEKLKLEAIFKNALLLQATSYAEGIDLSGYANLVIYSQDFSTARHTQRRARQANMKRDTAIIVHFLLVKKAISAQVYKTVSVNKRNFVDSVFKKALL